MMSSPKAGRKEIGANADIILVREAHTMLSGHVSQWLGAITNQQNFPSKLSLNSWREKLVQNLGFVLHRILKIEAEKESNSTSAGSAANLKNDYQIAFELVILLNLVSLCQESASYASKEGSLTPEQLKTNASLEKRLDLINKYLKIFDPNYENSQNLLLADELLVAIPGKSAPQDRESILEIYHIQKRKYLGSKPPKKQKDEAVPSHATLKAINKLQLVSVSWPADSEKLPQLDNVKSMKNSSSDEKLIDLLATQNSRTMTNQRYVISEQKERNMELNKVFNAVDKLAGRLDNQTAMTKEQREAENLAQVEEAIERANRQTMDNQRFVLSKEKIEQLSLNDLVHAVERLATQRMGNQDAELRSDKQKAMLNVVADVVEKMRASSMDDQRFIAKVAEKMNMTPKELNSSIESLPISENSSMHSDTKLL